MSQLDAQVNPAVPSSEGSLGGGPAATDPEPFGYVKQPAKVYRIGLMIASLLEEARHMELDEGSRRRMGAIYRETIWELGAVMSPDLREELERFGFALSAEAPTASEVRVLHAQLLGWLEGLLHGIQTALFAQFLESQRELEQMQESGFDGRLEHEGTYL